VAVGIQDPVLGPPVIRKLARMWKNGCYYAEIDEAGHFVEEWGEEAARLAIEVFEKQGKIDGVRMVEPGKANL
jgi:haloalkane dehalogenase